MIEIDIPGTGSLSLKHLVLEYSGTLALDGNLIPGAREVLGQLASKLEIHILTVDSFGHAHENLDDLAVRLTVISGSDQTEAKLEYVRGLGADSVVAIGNGRSDRKMLEAAAIGIFTIQKQGGAVRTLGRADIVTTSVLEALELLRYPRRLIDTLAS